MATKTDLHATVGASTAFHATGDIENNFKKLTRLLLKVHYPTLVARERVLLGESAVFVPMLRYAITSMSHKLTRYLLNHGYAIYQQNDAKFMEAVYKICIHTFHYYPVLTQIQFSHPPKGYAERKIVLVTNIIQCCLTKHAELVKEAKNNPTGQVRSSSEKKKQREEVQARLTQAGKKSEELVHEEVVYEPVQEGEPSSNITHPAQRGRRMTREESRLNQSLNQSTRSASATRPRSASNTRTPLTVTRKKSKTYATRPHTAASAFGSSTAAPASSTQFGESSSANSSFYPNDTAAQESFSTMPDHAVERSTQYNGEVVDLQQLEREEQQQQLSASQLEGKRQHSPVKKAWVHEHGGGDVNVSVVGFVADSNEGLEAPHHPYEPHSRSLQYSRAQDLVKLRKKEEAEAARRAAAEAEEDRLRLLRLQHQDYSMQNSPHVDHDQTRYQRSQERKVQQEFERDAEYDELPVPFSASFNGTQSQAHQLSASQRSMNAQQSPSRHTVGDENGLNASFNGGRVNDEPIIQRGGQGTASGVGDLDSLNSQLSQIAHRTNRTAIKVVSHKKAPRSSPNRTQTTNAPANTSTTAPQIPSVQYSNRGGVSAASSFNGLNSQRANLANPRTDSTNSTGAQLTSTTQPGPVTPPNQPMNDLLSSVQPRLSTPLETQLFSMLENISAKMTLMQSEMVLMEKKMERLAERTPVGTTLSASQANFLANSQPQQVASVLNNQPNTTPGPTVGTGFHHDLPRNYHPLPSTSANHLSASSSTASSARQHGLVPHPSHTYNPGMSYFGIPRGRDVNQLHSQPSIAGNRDSAPVAATTAIAYAGSSNSRQTSPLRATSSLHPSTSHTVSSPPRIRQSHPAGEYVSPARRAGYVLAQKEHQLAMEREEQQQQQQNRSPYRSSGHTPVKILEHTPSMVAQQSTDAAATTYVPTTSLSATSSLPSFHSSNQYMSTFNPGHTFAGAAALAESSVIPATDDFIEQLKARVRQTNELLGTARLTQKAYEQQSSNY